MKRRSNAFLALTTTLVAQLCLGQNDAFLMKVESEMRAIANYDEGLLAPEAQARLQEGMKAGDDWDRALLQLIQPTKYDSSVINAAQAVLDLRGKFLRPEVQAAIIANYKYRVNADREHDKADPLFSPSGDSSALASDYAKRGGPDLLQAILDSAISPEERANPLLDMYSLRAIANALLEKGDARHLVGMRKLLATAGDDEVREKLQRAIAAVESKVGSPEPEVPLKQSPGGPSDVHATTTPFAATSIKIPSKAQTSAENTSHGLWWAGGTLVVASIALFAFYRRRR